MRILSREEFIAKKHDFIHEIEQGALFIYPTDTIYGIGCSALDSAAVSRVRELKQRKDAPFSVIAPSLGWIRNCCVVNDNAEEWLEKLPGALTLILKKGKKCVAEEVAPKIKTLGVRMPDHWFLEEIRNLDIPIVSTSANKHGEQYMTSLDDLDDDIRKNVSFIIYEGEKKGKPSRLVDLSDTFKIIER